MSNELNSESDPGQPIVYQIRINGHLDRQWTDWFGGLTIMLEDNALLALPAKRCRSPNRW